MHQGGEYSRHWWAWRLTAATVVCDVDVMEQEKEHVNPRGLTGDHEVDRYRKRATLFRIERLRKDFLAGQHVDLFASMGSNVRPAKKNSQFKKDQKTIMVALALGLHEHIPEQMAAKYGFDTRAGSDENPPAPPCDPHEPPF